MKKNLSKIKERYKGNKEKSLLIYLILRILVIVCMVFQIIRGEWGSAFLCILSLILFAIPTIIEDKFKIDIPSVLQAIIYLFIFAAEILGEINNFYFIIPHWDTILHVINGFLAAGIGFSLIDLLNQNIKSINLSPVFVAIVAICFSMTIGILWEFLEYGADKILNFDMQKDEIVSSISTVELDPNRSNKVVTIKNIEETKIITSDGEEIIIKGGYLDIGVNDTVQDLMVNFIGAIIFSFIGYLYLKNREKYKFATNFIPKKSETKNNENCS